MSGKEEESRHLLEVFWSRVVDLTRFDFRILLWVQCRESDGRQD